MVGKEFSGKVLRQCILPRTAIQGEGMFLLDDKVNTEACNQVPLAVEGPDLKTHPALQSPGPHPALRWSLVLEGGRESSDGRESWRLNLPVLSRHSALSVQKGQSHLPEKARW